MAPIVTDQLFGGTVMMTWRTTELGQNDFRKLLSELYAEGA